MFCSRCGQTIHSSSSQCPACGSPTGIVGTTPVLATRTVLPARYVGTAVRVSYAGFWLRLVAWAIDEALLGGFVLVILGRLISLARLGGSFGDNFEPIDDMSDWYAALGFGVMLLVFLAFIVASWLYHALMESSPWQGTIGKRALGIVVTDMSGSPINFGRASGRYFGRLVSSMIPLGVGYALAGFTAQKQALHDLISSCLVLRRAR